MKNIDQYIIEKEYKEYFLIEEGFWNWLKKLGKKFWEWITDKDYSDENLDWNVGKTKKLKWAFGDSSYFEKMKRNKSLCEIFPNTARISDKYKNISPFTAVNSDGNPIVQIMFSTDKTVIHELMNKTKDYDENKSKINNVKKPVIIISIEVAKKNEDDNEDIFDDYITKQIDDNFIDEYDVVFLDNRHLKSFMKLLEYKYDFDSKFPVINGNVDWDDIDNDTNQKEEPTKEEPKEEPTKEEPKKEEPKKEEPTKEEPKDNEFELDNLLFKFVKDKNVINKFIKDNKLKTDYAYVVINDIDFIEKENNKSKSMQKTITSKDFEKVINGIANVKDDTEVRVCFVLNRKDVEQKDILNILSNLSSEIDGTIDWDVEDIDNGLFIYTLSNNITESLDVDNLFWMLDTWFGNNEQEKTSFMSLIDNCIIKKTYNKNDLAKLCDNINFDIRPFINFMSKDAVVTDGQKEDYECDYYYELKKIIDALISNKATSNKYVRFS